MRWRRLTQLPAIRTATNSAAGLYSARRVRLAVDLELACLIAVRFRCPNVRFGSQADIRARIRDVHFGPQERTLESHQRIAASQDKWLDGQIVGWARLEREPHHRRVSA
jgi:hypothetical protein